MPDIETCALKQDAVVWMANGVPDRYGETSLSSPVDTKIRLEQVKRKNLEGVEEPITYDAIADVSIAIPEKSIIRLGTVNGLPAEPDNLYQVREYQEIPDIKNKVSQRYVMLDRYDGALPTVS